MYVKIKPCKEHLYWYTMKYMPDTKVVGVMEIDEEMYFFKQLNPNKQNYGQTLCILKKDAYETNEKGEPICQKK